MRFMMMIKSDEQSEAGALPDEQVFVEMGKYNDALTQAGALLAAEGLQPTSKGARVKFSRGKPTVTDGPFAEAKEVIAGYWIIRANSLQEAIEWAKRVPFEAGETPANSTGAGEVEVRQLFELEDFPVGEEESGWREKEAEWLAASEGSGQIGVGQQQGSAGKRFIIFRKADKDTEAGLMPSEELLTAMGQYNEALINAGIMLAGDGLHPSSKGARVRYSRGKRTVIDGPFTESKELIAGFTMIRASSKEEALDWVKRWPPVDGNGEAELEVRQVFDLEDLPPAASG